MGTYSSCVGRGSVFTGLAIYMVFACIILGSVDDCSATPVTSRRPKEKTAVRRERPQTTMHPLQPLAPHERCFEETCNRVNQYCDQNTHSCESCETDCHPSRIEGDEKAVKECQTICDWYYFIKSLNVPSELVSPAAVLHKSQPEDHGNNSDLATKFVLAIIVVSICFTLIIMVLLGFVAHCFCTKHKQRSSPFVTEEQTEDNFNRNIRREASHEPHWNLDSKRKDIETNIKLLDNTDTSSNIQAGQQTSLRTMGSTNTDMTFVHQNGVHRPEVHTASICYQEDSFTQRLV